MLCHWSRRPVGFQDVAPGRSCVILTYYYYYDEHIQNAERGRWLCAILIDIPRTDASSYHIHSAPLCYIGIYEHRHFNVPFSFIHT